MKHYNALIDTGAVETVISNQVVNDLKLKKSGLTTTVVSANSKGTRSNKYGCYLLIQGHTKTFTLNCATTNIPDADVIIGMDIIELIDLELKNKQMVITI